MIDTIILELKGRRFIVQDYGKFKTTKENFENLRSFRMFYNNPTKQDKENGVYKPRLTLMKRGREHVLKLEFSAPKILFTENVSELKEEDFEKIVETLVLRLEEMGVWTTKNFIKKADVSSFHPSKNISLENGYTSSFALTELSKIKLNGKMDFTETKFRNDGSALQYYSVSHSFVIYDKKYDLGLPPARAIDKDQTTRQSSLFDNLKPSKKIPEILRLEVRLSKKRKMNNVLEKLGYAKNPTFQDIFKKELFQKVIKDYWQTMIVNENLFVFDMTNSPLRIMQRAIKNNRKQKAKQIIYLTGLEILCKEKGIRELRKNVALISKSCSWRNISKDIAKINSYKEEPNPHGFIKDIEKQIEEFKPYKFRQKDTHR